MADTNTDAGRRDATPPAGSFAAPDPGALPPNPAGPDGRRPVLQPRRGIAGHRGERAHGLARRMPDWMGSVRFRLTALYSLVLFGLASAMVAGLYAVLARRLNHEQLYVSYERVQPFPGGVQVTRGQMLDQYRLLEHLANERSLSLLRTYSLTALAGFLVVSLLVGWAVAGRVLAPIGHITEVAREIQATDLSRRIGLPGPADELTELADTFDDLLGRLDDAFEGQQRFIQETSHELRNPLAIIRTNLDVTLADPDADSAELRRVAELVQGAASRMSHLVDDLLVYARQGAPARDVAPVDLGALVRDGAAEYEVPARARSIRLDVTAPEGVVLDGDRPALRQVLANLLSNAVRLAPEGSTVSVGTGTDAAGVWLGVADEGPGIAPGDQTKVFERFWRGDHGEGRREGRSGLGLAIVEQIARDHGGTATVEPSPAGGSTFTVHVPVTRPTPMPSGPSKP